MPFVGAWCAELLCYAGLEAECEPAARVAPAVRWSDCSVGALVEWPSAGCKVLVWRSSDLAVGPRLGRVVVHRELVQYDTGPWLQRLGLQMQEGSLVLAAVLAGWPLPRQSAAEPECDIPKHCEPVAEWRPRSSDKFVARSEEKSKSLLPLPAVVVVVGDDGGGDLVLGSSVHHVAAQRILRYLPQVGSVAHSEVCSWQHRQHAGC